MVYKTISSDRRDKFRRNLILEKEKQKFFFRGSTNSIQVKSLKKEYAFLKSLKCNYIIKPIKWLEFGNLKGFILPYLDNNSEFLDLSYNTFKIYLKFLWIALDYLKQKNCAHLDIKPQNIYFNTLTKEFKLLDFDGYAYASLKSIRKYSRFTGNYASPETYTCKHRKVSIESDFFSMGVMIYEYFFQKFPLKKLIGENLEFTFNLSSPVKTEYSIKWKKVISGLCSTDYKQRFVQFDKMKNMIF